VKTVIIAVSFILVVTANAFCYDNQGGYENTTGYNNTVGYSNTAKYHNTIDYYELFQQIKPRKQKVQGTVGNQNVQAIIEVNTEEDKSLQKEIE
jgi:hypothetical protein